MKNKKILRGMIIQSRKNREEIKIVTKSLFFGLLVYLVRENLQLPMQ